MVNFLQQRDDLYFLISILPAEDNIEAMLDRDAAAAEEEAERDGSFTGAAAEEPEGRKLPFRAGS